MNAFVKHHILTGFLTLSLLAMYAAFAYDLNRADFPKLISLIVGLFFLSYALYKRARVYFWFLVGVAFTARLVFIVTLPGLSQDFYRFLWDARLLAQGINPYLQTVQSFIDQGLQPVAQSDALYKGMGALNAGHYTNYPPINQLFFLISGWLSPNSILGGAVVLRLTIILADLGILYFGSKLLKSLKLPRHFIFWFILNPFVIIEFSGNLHFESVMLFFFMWALYLLHNKHWAWAAVLIGVSISVKLLPLLLLPLLLTYFNTKDLKEASFLHRIASINIKTLVCFYGIVILTILVTFLPFLSIEFITNFLNTIGLWFQNFEFNASVYYIIRWIGFQTIGWNIIGTVGKILPIVVVLSILAIATFKRIETTAQLLVAMLFAVSVYFLLSTTVHPWYVATPLLLSVFTRYRFAIVWSLLVMLSYSAYGEEFNENLWLVAVEYLVVIGMAVYEIWIVKHKRPLLT